MQFEQRSDGRVTCPFDHHSPEFSERFSEILDEMRERAPLAWSDNHGGYWIATSYDLVRRLARDSRRFQLAQGEDRQGGLSIPPPPKPTGKPRPLFVPGEADGDEHDKYRLALNPMFTKQRVVELRPMIDRHVMQTIDTILAMEEFDAIHDFSGPILSGIALEYLGLDVDDPYRFTQSMHQMTRHAGEADEVAQQFYRAWDYVASVVSARRTEPKSDLISHLTHWDDPVFSDEEVQMMAWNVVLGAGDTTTTLISQAMLYLDQHPELRATLSQNPQLIVAAVDEFLRLITPAMGNGRTAMADVEIDGIRIRKGDRVLLSLWGANHDPRRYPSPHDFDLERGADRHLAMYVGEHFCLGAWLAKSIAEVSLTQLLRRVPDFRVEIDRAVPVEDRSSLNKWMTMPTRAR